MSTQYAVLVIDSTSLSSVLCSPCGHSVCVSSFMCYSIIIQVERETSNSMQRLVELDNIKTRMQESQNALQVHTCHAERVVGGGVFLSGV